MKKVRKRNLYKIMYIIFLFLWAASFVIMPFGYMFKESNLTTMYIAGGCFWLGIIGTAISGILSNVRGKRKFGFIRFFTNKVATIVDIVMIVAILGFIISNELIDKLTLSFIFLGVFIFSLGLHCWFNGEEK